MYFYCFAVYQLIITKKKKKLTNCKVNVIKNNFIYILTNKHFLLTNVIFVVCKFLDFTNYSTHNLTSSILGFFNPILCFLFIPQSS